MDYPVWDLAMGGGLLMALVAIPHVIVSHFAVFVALLVAGLAATASMVRRVLTSPASGTDAA